MVARASTRSTMNFRARVKDIAEVADVKIVPTVSLHIFELWKVQSLILMLDIIEIVMYYSSAICS